MTGSRESLGFTGWIWRIVAVALVYFAGTAMSGALVTMIGMQFPKMPSTPTPDVQLRLGLVGAVLVALCVAPLARGLRGSLAKRWLILTAFTYVCLGLNNLIEASVFTTYGGTATMILFFVLPCVFCAGVATALIPGPDAGAISSEPAGRALPGRPLKQWWWRLVVVWLAFPVIYYFFGMIIYPMVRDVYEQPDSGLVLPEGSVVVQVVLLRSLLFMAVTIPLVFEWARSRRGLALTLGGAFFVMVGLFGLLQATWWPLGMRAIHGAEILADSLVYAWVVVALLVPKSAVEKPAPSPAAE